MKNEFSSCLQSSTDAEHPAIDLIIPALQSLTASELTPAVLQGATIYGVDDHKVGKIDHIHASGGAGGSAGIDVGGFVGIGAKLVAVSISDLEFMRDEDRDVHAVTI